MPAATKRPDEVANANALPRHSSCIAPEARAYKPQSSRHRLRERTATPKTRAARVRQVEGIAEAKAINTNIKGNRSLMPLAGRSARPARHQQASENRAGRRAAWSRRTRAARLARKVHPDRAARKVTDDGTYTDPAQNPIMRDQQEFVLSSVRLRYSLPKRARNALRAVKVSPSSACGAAIASARPRHSG